VQTASGGVLSNFYKMNQDAFLSRRKSIPVPDLGIEEETLTFVTGLIPDGARVIPGERIAELLVRGIVFHLEAEREGRFVGWSVSPGARVRVGEELGGIVEEDNA